MAEATYDIHLTGRMAEGVGPAAALAELESLMKLPAGQAAQLLRLKRTTLVEKIRSKGIEPPA